MNFDKLMNNHFFVDGVTSFIFVLVLLFVKSIVVKSIHNRRISKMSKLKWKTYISNSANMLLLLGLFIIWSSEIQTLALSFVAIAAAMAIATKELLLCFVGGWYRIISSPFKLGDRIEVNGIRGDVIDNNFASTTVLEVGPDTNLHRFSGRSITIPNSVFLSHPIVNETYMNKFVFHFFNVPIPCRERWQECEEKLLKISNEICSSYISEAKKHIQTMELQKNLDIPKAEPTTLLQVKDLEKYYFILRVPTPAIRKGSIEQKIIREYLQATKDFGPTQNLY